MSGTRCARRRLRTAALATAVVGVLLGTPAPASSVDGADPTSGDVALVADMSAFRPLMPWTGSRLRLAGTLTNHSADDLAGAAVTAAVSQSPLTTWPEFEALGRQELETFTRSVDLGNVEVAEDLAAGAASPWTANLPAANLGFDAPGAYLLELSFTYASPLRTTRMQTIVPWVPPLDSRDSAVKVLWLWPVSDWPNRDADSTFLNDETIKELAPGGRLGRVIAGAARNPAAVSWVIDPQVPASASVASRPHSVVGVDGGVEQRAADPAAQSWLDELRRSTSNAQTYPMPYGHPDVVGLMSADLSQDVTWATTAASVELESFLGPTAGRTLGWSVSWPVTRQALDLFQVSGIRSVVTGSDGLANPEPEVLNRGGLLRYQAEAGEMNLLVADSRMTQLVSTARWPTPNPSGPYPAGGIGQRQAFLGVTAALWASGATEQPLIVAPTATWDPGPTLNNIVDSLQRSRSWLRPVTVDDVVAAGQPSISNPWSDTAQTDRYPGLGRAYFARISDAQDALDVLSSILPDDSPLAASYRQALLRTASANWANKRSEARSLLTRVTEELSATMGQVRVLSQAALATGSNDVDIPITIANGLDTPVRVGVTLTSDTPVRLVADPVPVMTVPAQRTVTVSAPVQVLGAGDLQVSAQLVTPNGEPLGDSTTFEIRSAAYAQAAAWVVGIAFVLLALLLVLNSIRRRRAATDSTSSP